MKVLMNFIDKFDKHEYSVGDDFPHADSVVAEFKPERIEELSSLGYVGEDILEGEQKDELVQEDDTQETEQEESEFPKHLGGGSYELSNGEKIKGKQAAVEAEDALKAGE